jgi:hypothetical protein
MPNTITRELPPQVRAEIIAYLVRQEHPRTPHEEAQLRGEWDAINDYDLIEAYNYNRLSSGYPPKRFE